MHVSTVCALLFVKAAQCTPSPSTESSWDSLDGLIPIIGPSPLVTNCTWQACYKWNIYVWLALDDGSNPYVQSSFNTVKKFLLNITDPCLVGQPGAKGDMIRVTIGSPLLDDVLVGGSTADYDILPPPVPFSGKKIHDLRCHSIGTCVSLIDQLNFTAIVMSGPDGNKHLNDFPMKRLTENIFPNLNQWYSEGRGVAIYYITNFMSNTLIQHNIAQAVTEYSIHFNMIEIEPNAVAREDIKEKYKDYDNLYVLENYEELKCTLSDLTFCHKMPPICHSVPTTAQQPTCTADQSAQCSPATADRLMSRLLPPFIAGGRDSSRWVGDALGAAAQWTSYLGHSDSESGELGGKKWRISMAVTLAETSLAQQHFDSIVRGLRRSLDTGCFSGQIDQFRIISSANPHAEYCANAVECNKTLHELDANDFINNDVTQTTTYDDSAALLLALTSMEPACAKTSRLCLAVLLTDYLPLCVARQFEQINAAALQSGYYFAIALVADGNGSQSQQYIDDYFDEQFACYAFRAVLNETQMQLLGTQCFANHDWDGEDALRYWMPNCTARAAECRTRNWHVHLVPMFVNPPATSYQYGGTSGDSDIYGRATGDAGGHSAFGAIGTTDAEYLAAFLRLYYPRCNGTAARQRWAFHVHTSGLSPNESTTIEGSEQLLAYFRSLTTLDEFSVKSTESNSEQLTTVDHLCVDHLEFALQSLSEWSTEHIDDSDYGSEVTIVTDTCVTTLQYAIATMMIGKLMKQRTRVHLIYVGPETNQDLYNSTNRWHLYSRATNYRSLATNYALGQKDPRAQVEQIAAGPCTVPDKYNGPEMKHITVDDGNTDGYIWWLTTCIVVSVGFIALTATFFTYKRRRLRQMVTEMEVFVRTARSHYNGGYSRSRGASDIPLKDSWELPSERLVIYENIKLGKGAFGCVFKGRLLASKRRQRLSSVEAEAATSSGTVLSVAPNATVSAVCNGREVAVKTLPKYACNLRKESFLREIDTVKGVWSGGGHRALVQLLGCITESEPLCLVFAYCPNCDLLTWLHGKRIVNLQPLVKVDNFDTGDVITAKDLLKISWEIADGMVFLSESNWVHIDLAARNVLLDEQLRVKISDFGMCQKLGKNGIVKVDTQTQRLAVKWMAIESLFKAEFSVKSDVWSLGVCMYEIFSMGRQPYADVPINSILLYIEAGNRLPQPAHAADDVYGMMRSCWLNNPADRPDFAQMKAALGRLLDSATEDYGYLTVVDCESAATTPTGRRSPANAAPT